MNPISPHVPATFRQFPHLGLRGVLLLLGLAAAVLPAACTSGGDGSVTGDHGSTVALSAPIEPGETCAYGGYQIDYGVDKNGNGTLDPDEIAGTAVLCNGAEGAAGTPGNDGTPGQDGKDGTPGTPGADGRDATAIVYRFTRTSANASCVQGGTRIDLGRDDGLPAGTASNGVLEDGEIERTDWLCANGAGVSEGTVALPVPVTPGTTLHAKVAAASSSYYRFTTPAGGLSLIGLTRTDSDLTWTLYSDAAFTTVVTTCDNHQGYDADERCAVPLLSGGQSYYLAVSEVSNIPNLMDLTVGGDVLLAADSLGRLYEVDTTYGSVTELSRTGASGITSMAFEPTRGLLLAGLINDELLRGPAPYDLLSSESVSFGGKIEILDPFTGAATDITPSLLTDDAEPMPIRAADRTGMAVDYATHEVLVMNDNECASVDSFDPVTFALATVVDGDVLNPPCQSVDSSGLPIVMDGANALYLVFWAGYNGGYTELYRLVPDPTLANDDAQYLGNFYFTGFPVVEGNEGFINSLAVRPSDGLIFATTTAGFLVTLDVLDQYDLSIQYVATLDRAVDGLTFIGGTPPPPPVADFQGSGCSTNHLTWRDYPAAQSMLIYWGVTSGIDPANESSYDGVITVPRVDTSASYDHPYEGVYPAPYYYRIVPVVDGVPGPVSWVIVVYPEC